ncbi:hypothetical protein PM082_001832 [Marasmius tenuissimus]|nr:hypothetical protein PM082_001832 [Marasmius tenuissimus]
MVQLKRLPLISTPSSTATADLRESRIDASFVMDNDRIEKRRNKSSVVGSPASATKRRQPGSDAYESARCLRCCPRERLVSPSLSQRGGSLVSAKEGRGEGNRPGLI